MSAVRRHGLVSRPVVSACALIALILAVGAGQPKVAEIVAACIVGWVVGSIVVRTAARWDWLIYVVASADLVIPEDARYTLRGFNHAGFQLEPYRLLVTVMVVGWIGSQMVDPRVRPRRTRFDGPLIMIWLAIVGSELLNPARSSALSSAVIKAVVLIASLMIFVYVVVSVVRSRETIERVLAVLVAAGCVEAFGALVERTTKFNMFNHLHRFLLVFNFNGAAELGALLRNGHFRALASAGHPIELANEMAMLTGLAVYLGIRRGRLWWGAIPLLLLGNLSSGSRTGVLGLLAVVLVFLLMRPRETLKFWPALVPTLVVVQILMPGSLSGVVHAFFPKGGLIAQQSQTFAAHGQVQQASRLSRLGPQLRGVFEKHNEFFGEGYGTRVIGRTTLDGGGAVASVQARAADNAQLLDDQWLGDLLETGLIGVIGWAWLFARVVRQLGARAKLERGSPEGWLPVSLAAAIACYALSMFFYDAATFVQGTVMLYLLLGLAGSLVWLPIRSPEPVPQRGRTVLDTASGADDLELTGRVT